MGFFHQFVFSVLFLPINYLVAQVFPLSHILIPSDITLSASSLGMQAVPNHFRMERTTEMTWHTRYFSSHTVILRGGLLTSAVEQHTIALLHAATPLTAV